MTKIICSILNKNVPPEIALEAITFFLESSRIPPERSRAMRINLKADDVNNAMNWDRTPQGATFWETIHDADWLPRNLHV